MPSGGINGWQGLGTEPAYGETLDARRLMQAAPLAGARMAGAGTQPVTQRRPRPQQVVTEPSYAYLYRLAPTAPPSSTGAQQENVSSPPSQVATDPAWHLHLMREGLRAARSLAAGGHPEARAFLESIGARG